MRPDHHLCAKYRSMGVYNVDEVSVEDISRLMVGRDVVSKIDKSTQAPWSPLCWR